MTTMEASATDKKARQSIVFLRKIFVHYPNRDFAVRLWDGSVLPPETGCTRRFTLMVNHPGALKKLLWHPNPLGLGEAYAFKDLDVEGDLEAAMKLQEVFAGVHITWREKMQYTRWLLSLPATGKSSRRHAAVPGQGTPDSRARTRKAISFHYDLPIAFWQELLDDSLQYTCAYFNSWDNNLKTAQADKADYICRKLNLQPGETLLDPGAGWGGLILHAVKHYGVRAVGATLSKCQADYVRERIQAEGLGSRCRMELMDFRDLQSGKQQFDKIASVGSMEHCYSFLDTYFQTMWRLLKPGGLFLNHAIASTFQYPMAPPHQSFINKYVFPDGELNPVSSTLMIAEQAGFEVRDVENLREHYAQTLRLWIENLERRQEELTRIAGEVTWRVFKLYMTACAVNFNLGRLNLFQALLAKADDGRTPCAPTRREWYS